MRVVSIVAIDDIVAPPFTNNDDVTPAVQLTGYNSGLITSEPETLKLPDVVDVAVTTGEPFL